MKLQADSREFIGLLNSHEVEYLIVGGYAVAYRVGEWEGEVEPASQHPARLFLIVREARWPGRRRRG